MGLAICATVNEASLSLSCAAKTKCFFSAFSVGSLDHLPRAFLITAAKSVASRSAGPTISLGSLASYVDPKSITPFFCFATFEVRSK